MIILEVRQTELDREITALRELPFESEVMEAFYGGARIALEWLRDGSAAPSRMFHSRRQPDVDGPAVDGPSKNGRREAPQAP
jgi:hypothetical protein